MCHAAQHWILNDIGKRDDLKPAEKWLLIMMADHANREAWSFIHGHKTLATDTGMSKRTVVTMLARFEELGLLKRAMRFRDDGTRSTDLISLMGGENPALGAIQSAENDAHHVQIALPEGVKSAQHKQETKPGKLTKKEANASVGSEADEVRQAFEAYNVVAERIGASHAARLSDDRRRRLKARLKDAGGLEGWYDALRRAERSPFLTGQTHHHFGLTLDFILQPLSFTKLIEGQYEERHDGGSPASPRSGPVDYAAERATARLDAMVDGARQAAVRVRRWSI